MKQSYYNAYVEVLIEKEIDATDMSDAFSLFRLSATKCFHRVSDSDYSARQRLLTR